MIISDFSLVLRDYLPLKKKNKCNFFEDLVHTLYFKKEIDQKLYSKPRVFLFYSGTKITFI